MPRTARIVIAGYPHHIIQRGHNRQVIFASEDDYLYPAFPSYCNEVGDVTSIAS